MSNILIVTLWKQRIMLHGGCRGLYIGVYAAGNGCGALRAEIKYNDGARTVYSEISPNPKYTMMVIDSLREACGV